MRRGGEDHPGGEDPSPDAAYEPVSRGTVAPTEVGAWQKEMEMNSQRSSPATPQHASKADPDKRELSPETGRQGIGLSDGSFVPSERDGYHEGEAIRTC